MKITCENFKEALKIIANSEKSTKGKSNSADFLEIDFHDNDCRIEVDYTDDKHRSISINMTEEETLTWKDKNINIDEIASALYTNYCLTISSVLDYIDNICYSVHKFTISLKRSDKMSIKIDTSERLSNETEDSLANGCIHAKISITYKDKDEHDELTKDIKNWMEKNSYGRPYETTEE